MFKQFLPALKATLVLATLTGILFPVGITILSQLFFSEQANGSLIRTKAKIIVGSKLIGQPFSRPEYFHPRPSAAGAGYAGEMSSGTNLGPTSSKLILGQADDPSTRDADETFDGVKQLAEKYRLANFLRPEEKVPVDAVTRSGSGLDPDISPQNALLQARRVARARHLTEPQIKHIIQAFTQSREFGIFGEPRVNVLALNLALDDNKAQ